METNPACHSGIPVSQSQSHFLALPIPGVSWSRQEGLVIAVQGYLEYKQEGLVTVIVVQGYLEYRQEGRVIVVQGLPGVQTVGPGYSSPGATWSTDRRAGL